MTPGKLQKNKQRSQGLRWKVYDCVLFDLCSDTMPVSGLHHKNVTIVLMLAQKHRSHCALCLVTATIEVNKN